MSTVAESGHRSSFSRILAANQKPAELAKVVKEAQMQKEIKEKEKEKEKEEKKKTHNWTVAFDDPSTKQVCVFVFL